MVEERERGPEDAQQRRGASPDAESPGDPVPPGIAGSGGREEGSRRGAARHPGDAVPLGVAPLEPQEPTEEDRRVLEKLCDLPRRARRRDSAGERAA